MQIYVAAKFESKGEAKALMRTLESRGHSITYDWTVHETATARLDQCAMNDLGGVLDADMIVLIWHPGLKGGLVELGCALGIAQGSGVGSSRGIHIAVIGCPPVDDQPCVFFHHPMIMHFNTVPDFLSWHVLEWRR